MGAQWFIVTNVTELFYVTLIASDKGVGRRCLSGEHGWLRDSVCMCVCVCVSARPVFQEDNNENNISDADCCVDFLALPLHEVRLNLSSKNHQFFVLIMMKP